MDQIVLDAVEVRVLGALVEKEMATPEHYPLSLNALTAACNQKSNRDPVMDLSEEGIVPALDRLRRLGFAMQSAESGRVAKYRHALAEKLGLDPEELAILAELLLRGPQTPGELRNRAERMRPFPDLQAVDLALQELMDREQALAVRLPRQPGRKECRYAHLFSGPPEEAAAAPPLPSGGQEPSEERLLRLEEEIKDLRNEMVALRRDLATFREQFE